MLQDWLAVLISAQQRQAGRPLLSHLMGMPLSLLYLISAARFQVDGARRSEELAALVKERTYAVQACFVHLLGCLSCRRQREAAERAERARNFKVAAWAEQAEEAGSSEEAEEEVVVDKLYCPACDKLFRSEGAYTNHERWADLPH